MSIFVSCEQQNRQRGYGFFEFGVAAAVFAVLLAVLLHRVMFYQEQAEKVSVQLVVVNIRSSIDIKVAEGKLPGRAVDFALLAEQNPMDWLADKPANYVGAFFSPSDDAVGAGNWYFDRKEKALVYLLNNGNSFIRSPVKRLKFKVKLFHLPENSVKPTGAPEIQGAAFEQVNG